MNEVKNLDAIINKVGFEIAQIIDENLINKILGVLSNDGVYAMWVYCLNKLSEKEYIGFLKQMAKLPIKVKDKNGEKYELQEEEINK